MRVLVHDYSGHPFQAQLSRALAGRGHEVLHASCSSYMTGKGALTRAADDPSTFEVHEIATGGHFERYAVASRLRHELEYGAAFTRCAADYRPDVVLSCNDPLIAKARAARWCKRSRTPWVFWLQDFYSVAMGKYMRSQLGPLGALPAGAMHSVERRLLHQAAAVVAITDDFEPLLRTWRVSQEKCHVIENWAPIDEIGPRPKSNPWAREIHLDDGFVFLYSGTLGLKHDPQLLVTLAEDPLIRAHASVLVISEGRGATWLKTQIIERGLDNLIVLPYQPYDRLPEVLGTADVLLVLLEHDAGIYSVPSKILTYLCAGRPILAAMPPANLGARIIEKAGAGVVVSQSNPDALSGAAAAMYRDPLIRRRYGYNGRTYAQTTFDIQRIAGQFEQILSAALGESIGS